MDPSPREAFFSAPLNPCYNKETIQAAAHMMLQAAQLPIGCAAENANHTKYRDAADTVTEI